MSFEDNGITGVPAPIDAKRNRFGVVPNWVVERCATKPASMTALGVYAALAQYRSGETSQAWPSYETLAADTGLSRRTIVTALAQLRDRGCIAWRRGAHGGNNLYALPGRPPDEQRPSLKVVAS